jgi:hypothetical protein
MERKKSKYSAALKKIKDGIFVSGWTMGWYEFGIL